MYDKKLYLSQLYNKKVARCRKKGFDEYNLLQRKV